MVANTPILNSAIADKEKFKEVLLKSIHLLGQARDDKYNFYTEEALHRYKELLPLLRNMGFSDEIHLNVQSFFMSLFYVMSIVHMVEENNKNKLESNNVIDFQKYKNNKINDMKIMNII